MLTPETKRFFADIAKGASKLSGCAQKHGAVLIRGLDILSYGINRKVIKDSNNPDWEVSAILDALYGSRDKDISGAILFSTKFPSVEDMKMIAAVGISSIYFFGEVNDAGSVALVNAMADSHIPLELVKLQ